MRLRCHVDREIGITLSICGLPWWLSGKRNRLQRKRPEFDPWVRKTLENGMTTHSSILARRIPQTEERGRLKSMGSQSQTQLKRLSLSFNEQILNFKVIK